MIPILCWIYMRVSINAVFNFVSLSYRCARLKPRDDHDPWVASMDHRCDGAIYITLNGEDGVLSILRQRREFIIYSWPISSGLDGFADNGKREYDKK